MYIYACIYVHSMHNSIHILCDMRTYCGYTMRGWIPNCIDALRVARLYRFLVHCTCGLQTTYSVHEK